MRVKYRLLLQPEVKVIPKRGLTIVPGGLMSPIVVLLSYNAKGGIFIHFVGLYTPWCYSNREKGT